MPDSDLRDLSVSQGGSGRHRCVICAFARGFSAGKKPPNPASLERCSHGRSAPTSALLELPESQGGPGRHKCATCAYQLGLEACLAKYEISVADDIATEEEAYGPTDSHKGDVEGGKYSCQSYAYERSAKNRARAIQLHGTVCSACGFDFNQHYTKNYAESYIQIHHLRAVSQGGEREVDPAIDLKPLCANCHCMVHRRRNQILEISRLVELIENARRTR